MEEGSKVLIKLEGDKIVIYPYVNPIWIALHERKFAKVTFEKPEMESIKIQKRKINDND